MRFRIYFRRGSVFSFGRHTLLLPRPRAKIYWALFLSLSFAVDCKVTKVIQYSLNLSQLKTFSGCGDVLGTCGGRAGEEAPLSLCVPMLLLGSVNTFKPI